MFFFSSRRRHTRFDCDWSSDVCSSDLAPGGPYHLPAGPVRRPTPGCLANAPPEKLFRVAERDVRAFPGPHAFPAMAPRNPPRLRSEEHTSELQSQSNLVCRLLLEKKKK